MPRDIYIEDLISPNFDELLYDVLDHRHTHYVLKGGRGSTKSSFISFAIILLMMQPGNEQMHALCLRKQEVTLRTSVFSQMQFAISKLGLDMEFASYVSPMRIVRRSTGQTILFRGVDDKDRTKLKSITPAFGYFGVTWFEECDAFSGMKEIRWVLQSTVRGGSNHWTFMSFNPPETRANFMNEEVLRVPPSWFVHTSDYRTVPRDWLGDQFIEDAEFLRQTNPRAYEHEYLGIVIGTGGEIFDNLRIEPISDSAIAAFDRIHMGIDWGWYPDPYAWVKMHYDAARHILYIFDEYRANKQSNRETWEALRTKKGVTARDYITADSAEPKSVADYVSYGALCYGAKKGPDSVRYSMKWLQSLAAIVIDPVRCPETAHEFQHYEYERDSAGNIISGYPDRDNHSIDAVRYAMESTWRRMGQ